MGENLTSRFTKTRQSRGHRAGATALPLSAEGGGLHAPGECQRRYYWNPASFTTASGQPRHYVATDYLEDPRLRALGTDGALSIARRADLRFDRVRRVGTVLHMLSSLDELGRAGITAISDSADKATALYDHAQATLIGQAAASLARGCAASSPTRTQLALTQARAL